MSPSHMPIEYKNNCFMNICHEYKFGGNFQTPEKLTSVATLNELVKIDLFGSKRQIISYHLFLMWTNANIYKKHFLLPGNWKEQTPTPDLYCRIL